MAAWDSPALDALLGQVACGADCSRPCGADDWSRLDARLHYIAHLFRTFHDDASLLAPPFTPAQLVDIDAGRLPHGTL